MNSFLCALSFLTIIPLPFVRFGAGGEELSKSASCFPLVGAILGLAYALTAWILLKIMPAAPVIVIVLILGFFLTRGLHFDGLADTADGLIGTTDRDKAFKAMDDSAVGVMGAVSIFFVYLLKFTLLAELDVTILPPALILMPFAGRWSIVYTGTWFSPARNRGLGDLFLGGIRWPILLKASLWAALLITFFSIWHAPLVLPVLAGCLFAFAAAHLLAFYASRRLGGISGDILGAASELGELFFLLGFYPLLQYSSIDFWAKAVVFLG